MTIMVLGFLLYMGYEKYCETKQINSITRMEGLTYKEIDYLIKKTNLSLVFFL